ncbi:tRNA (adenosine(37)-N6)-dimethylallyltransferase MiaA [Candidatus Profftella armatura]|uniref:tRNA dimethylallyltransferase n=3 Tax=cellular organisms TaxID=131567 RepID=A0A1S4EKT2_DIACI|nr:tRNA (adenosine(37)-N6)-dimethylallyltransferase MiaA [Candidatus Profftella armatura]XP_017302769.1 uncharacterized protein LOC103516991 [Diaphorina citri]AGS06874.1 split tRNA delta(2)-isopentenylpyrophosphate transferase [Candidatus Profftella armatura]
MKYIKNKPYVVAILGPTASGKSSVALKISEYIPCEIISIDSALVYCDMDIGTNKPSIIEREITPHHLIDIIEPTKSYSVIQFCEDALFSIKNILKKKKLPLLVGGTMLYFKALRDGINKLPPANLKLRTKFNIDINKYGISFLYDKLKLLDPVTANRLNPQDKQRIQRALEVIEITGKPISFFLIKIMCYKNYLIAYY